MTNAVATPIATAHASHDSQGVGHVVPFWVLHGVWIALLFLTYITVTATHVDFGSFNLWLSMGIATVKASLVVLYFMHLRYDHPFHGIVFVTALLFVMLFVVIVLLDTQEYQPQLIPDYAPAIHR